MQRIRSYFSMFNDILREESDGDLLYYLDNISEEDAYKVLGELTNKLIDKAQKETTKHMLESTYQTKDELIAQIIFITEKQRGYPISMGECGDIEERAEIWARENGYGHFFDE